MVVINNVVTVLGTVITGLFTEKVFCPFYGPPALAFSLYFMHSDKSFALWAQIQDSKRLNPGLTNGL